jgi:hypothetical protein
MKGLSLDIEVDEGVYLTSCLYVSSSPTVMVSALAMTGITVT